MSSTNHFYLFVTITYENNRREDGRFYSSLFSEICAQGYCAIVMSLRNAEHFGCVLCFAVTFLPPLLVSWETMETEARYKLCGYATREEFLSNVPSLNIYHIMMDYL